MSTIDKKVIALDERKNDKKIPLPRHRSTRSKIIPSDSPKEFSSSHRVVDPQNRYLRLLLGALFLEVLGVLTSSHSLKFRSNTHRKGSLLINNNLLNSQSFIFSAV